MVKKLFCGECLNEIETCDECFERFKEGDEIICCGLNHIHKDCIDNLESEVISKDDKFL